MKALVILVAAALLAGCASDGETRIETRVVPVPVRVACVPKDTPTPGAYADDELPTGQDQAAERYKRRATANEQRRARLALIEPIIASCR